MRAAQKAYRLKEWDKFKKILADSNNEKRDLLEDFDLFGNTAINIAARSDKPEILKELLGKLSEEERGRVLRKKNHQGNTLLHEIAVFCKVVEMADIVLDLEKTTPLPVLAEAEETAELPDEEKRRPLVEWTNLKGETPVFRAAKFGKLEILSHLVKRAQGNMKIHQESPGETILHASVNGQYFDVALWIIMTMDKSSMVGKKNQNGLTCLQLLARMPHAFKSHYYDNQELITKLVYKLLPDEGYDIEGCNSFGLLRSPVTDIETGRQDDARPPTPGYLSRVNFAVWKCLAPVFNWIESIWKEKKKHQLAERLAGLLVRCDYSWQLPYDERKYKTSDELPPVLYNVAKRKKELHWRHKKEIIHMDCPKHKDELKAYKHHPALLIAASNGIQEILNLYIKEHPESINHVSKEDGQNLLHIAVRHRQEKILDRLEKQPDLNSLASQVNQENRTALHEVAGIDYYRGSALAGAAFQLQEELEFYKRVEKIVPPHLHMHCDDKRLTAGDLLDIAHDDMLADAQKWIKETAQSCSTVSILVASVVAAAYTIPGGIEGRSALLLKTPVFIFFTTMDIVALAFSLASVVMFLSILNAPFELWDFHKSLPQRLTLGFAFLFLSLTTTMLAFSATILITIRLQWKEWTSTLVYSAALFPVTIFALIEFPLYMKIPRLFFKFFKKMTSVGRSSTTAI
ncbi:hypothetical protein QN277_005436 [Acacia crassicarpa]|uniref:PGG domain-containing protein n=1 Tax=Acacia crassicarpa TaxID=499986 RepID=A0AAE1IWB1_9FABA|nr:hypothetical protein QN277_005436 [Acacia crassicarpa]